MYLIKTGVITSSWSLLVAVVSCPDPRAPSKMARQTHAGEGIQSQNSVLMTSWHAQVEVFGIAAVEFYVTMARGLRLSKYQKKIRHPSPINHTSLFRWHTIVTSKMKLLLPVSLALASCGANASIRSASRRLSYEKIGSYEPLSKVTDHVSFVRDCRQD